MGRVRDLDDSRNVYYRPSEIPRSKDHRSATVGFCRDAGVFRRHSGSKLNVPAFPNPEPSRRMFRAVQKTAFWETALVAWRRVLHGLGFTCSDHGLLAESPSSA